MFLSVPGAVGGWWIHMVVQLHEMILDVLIRPGALQLNMQETAMYVSIVWDWGRERMA